MAAATVEYDIEIARGFRWSMELKYYQPLTNGLPDTARPVSLVGWTVEMSVYDDSSMADPPLLVLRVGAGVTLDAPNGTALIVIDPTQSAALPAMSGYYRVHSVPQSLPEFPELWAEGRAVTV